MRDSSNLDKSLFAKIKTSKRITLMEAGNNSVLTPSAQHVTPCDLREELEVVIKAIEFARAKLMNECPPLFALLDIQYTYGLRISEALGIKVMDIFPSGKILVRGLKGSMSRIITPGMSLSYFQRCQASNIHPFVMLDRFFVYRQYNKMGIKHYFKENGKYAVTHIFRYLAIKELSHGCEDYELVSKFIGHKNKSNTKIYGKKV